MRRSTYRLWTAVMIAALLLSLCACGETAATVTTTKETATTTTVADAVTTTVTDGETTTVTDGETTVTVDGETTANGQPTAGPTTAGKPTVETTATTNGGSWGGLIKPAGSKTTVTVTTTTKRTLKTTATTAKKNYTNTVAPVIRNEKYKTDHGFYHILKGYCFGRVFRTEEWLRVVGYVTKEGQVADTMFEATTIMPSPGHVYWGEFGTKDKWDAWVKHTMLNLETLNRAAEQVQDALQLKEYKIKVFPTLVNPHNASDNPHYYDNWGYLNGVKMDVKNDDHREQMVRYLINTYITEIEKKQYNNIELAGFYWFDEYIVAEDLEWYNDITDYVRSKGLRTLISPFYRATGWQLCDEAGFDIHSMQSNYFPNGTVGILNCGTIQNLYDNAAIVNSGAIGGIEMELDNHEKKDGITGWKQTLKVGVQTGIVNGYHLHYYGGGPSTPVLLSKSTNPYFRSAYDETYLYMKNKLSVSDIWIEPREKKQDGT